MNPDALSSDEEEFFDDAHVEEFVEDGLEPMSEEDDMNDEQNESIEHDEDEVEPIQLDDIIFQDDSIQGFFTHKRTKAILFCNM